MVLLLYSQLYSHYVSQIPESMLNLVNAGKAPTALINLQMFRYVLIGGAGNTLGLVLLMCKSKSKHIRSIGRLSVLPGICGINEPIIFGTPIVSKSYFINSVSNHAMSFGRSWLSCSKYGNCIIRIYCRSIIYTILCTRILISIRYQKCYLSCLYLIATFCGSILSIL